MSNPRNAKLDAVFALEAGLSEWEIDFCEDVAVKLEQGGRLSAAQLEKLDQVYDEKVLGEERAAR
jgi:hypothetical protein